MNTPSHTKTRITITRSQLDLIGDAIEAAIEESSDQDYWYDAREVLVVVIDAKRRLDKASKTSETGMAH